MSINLQASEFLISAVNEKQYPKHQFKEIALVGRSNVGKSSLINALANRKNLARTSNQPGRTQTINFYRMDKIVIVDLPGYGFARVPESVRRAWRPMIEGYLTNRENLVGILQLVDIRHKPTKDDIMMTNWLKEMKIPFVIVATKADKLSKSKALTNSKQISQILGEETILFSAQTRQGKPEVLGILSKWAKEL